MHISHTPGIKPPAMLCCPDGSSMMFFLQEPKRANLRLFRPPQIRLYAWWKITALWTTELSHGCRFQHSFSHPQGISWGTGLIRLEVIQSSVGQTQALGRSNAAVKNLFWPGKSLFFKMKSKNFCCGGSFKKSHFPTKRKGTFTHIFL